MSCACAHESLGLWDMRTGLSRELGLTVLRAQHGSSNAGAPNFVWGRPLCLSWSLSEQQEFDITHIWGLQDALGDGD